MQIHSLDCSELKLDIFSDVLVMVLTSDVAIHTDTLLIYTVPLFHVMLHCRCMLEEKQQMPYTNLTEHHTVWEECLISCVSNKYLTRLLFVVNCD